MAELLTRSTASTSETAFARALRQAQADRYQFYGDRVQETVGQRSGVEVALQPLDGSGPSCSPAASCGSLLEEHGDLLSPDYWNAAKARIAAGHIADVFPCPEAAPFSPPVPNVVSGKQSLFARHSFSSSFGG
jgi:isocitrate dehydrogenase kinase/phosphatase